MRPARTRAAAHLVLRALHHKRVPSRQLPPQRLRPQRHQVGRLGGRHVLVEHRHHLPALHGEQGHANRQGHERGKQTQGFDLLIGIAGAARGNALCSMQAEVAQGQQVLTLARSLKADRGADCGVSGEAPPAPAPARCCGVEGGCFWSDLTPGTIVSASLSGAAR